MDVKTYYQKIRETEAGLPTAYVVVSSLATDAGGRSGVFVEVSRHLAAKMIVEGTAQAVDPAKAAAFLESQSAASKAANDAAAAAKVQVTVVSSEELKKLSDDFRRLQGSAKATKE